MLVNTVGVDKTLVFLFVFAKLSSPTTKKYGEDQSSGFGKCKQYPLIANLNSNFIMTQKPKCIFYLQNPRAQGESDTEEQIHFDTRVPVPTTGVQVLLHLDLGGTPSFVYWVFTFLLVDSEEQSTVPLDTDAAKDCTKSTFVRVKGGSLYGDHKASVDSLQVHFELTPELNAPLRRKDVENGVPSRIFGAIPKYFPNSSGLIATVGSIVIVECTPFSYNAKFPLTLNWKTGGKAGVLIRNWSESDRSVLVMKGDSGDQKFCFSGIIFEYPLSLVCHPEQHILYKGTGNCYAGFKWENHLYPSPMVITWHCCDRGQTEEGESGGDISMTLREFKGRLPAPIGLGDIFFSDDASLSKKLTEDELDIVKQRSDLNLRQFQILVLGILPDKGAFRRPFVLCVINPFLVLSMTGTARFRPFLDANLVTMVAGDFESTLMMMGLNQNKEISFENITDFQFLYMSAVSDKFYWIDCACLFSRGVDGVEVPFQS